MGWRGDRERGQGSSVERRTLVIPCTEDGQQVATGRVLRAPFISDEISNNQESGARNAGRAVSGGSTDPPDLHRLFRTR